MSMSVSNVPTTSVSNLYVQQRLLDQLNSDQTAMLNVETQLSTDKELSAASQDPVVAMQIMNLNNLLASNAQMTTNVTMNQSYMSQTDSALSSMSSLLSTAQSSALAVTGSTATADQRTAASQQISQIVQELMDLGNQQFDGRYLFAGSTTTVVPFTTTADGDIQYNGNDQNLTSFSDLNLPFISNVTGAEAIGAVSAPVDGPDLNPALTADTKLSDLNGGEGVTLGSIAISDGSGHQSIVDLSGAQTVGDVAQLLSANAPAGDTVQVGITATGLDIQLTPAGGGTSSVSISEVGGGVIAKELGILGSSSNGFIQGGDLNPALTLTTSLGDLAGGNGLNLSSGLQITDGGATYTINLANCNTIQDVINAINGSGAGVKAQIDPTKTGLEISSYTSGSDFTIGENGGYAATDLGLRTFGYQTPLADLNYGSGLGVYTGTPNDPNPPYDFTITAADGDSFNVSLVGCNTVGDVINKINDLSDGTVQAHLVSTGNGIELTDDGPAPGNITVTSNINSTAAADLGLIPSGAQTATSNTKGTASASISFGGTDSDLIITSNQAGTAGDVWVKFVDDGQAGDETVDYEPADQTLTFHIAAGVTQASTIVQLLQGNPNFTASLDTTNDPDNDGSGTITALTTYTSGGTEATLTGTDVNPQETAGVFNSLLRMSAALQSGDMTEVSRDITQLQQASQNLSDCQAVLGEREQSLSSAQTQLGSQNTQLQSLLSNDSDADLATVISQLTALQTAYQASLETIGQMFKMTLLNYL